MRTTLAMLLAWTQARQPATCVRARELRSNLSSDMFNTSSVSASVCVTRAERRIASTASADISPEVGGGVSADCWCAAIERGRRAKETRTTARDRDRREAQREIEIDKNHSERSRSTRGGKGREKSRGTKIKDPPGRAVALGDERLRASREERGESGLFPSGCPPSPSPSPSPVVASSLFVAHRLLFSFPPPPLPLLLRSVAWCRASCCWRCSLLLLPREWPRPAPLCHVLHLSFSEDSACSRAAASSSRFDLRLRCYDARRRRVRACVCSFARCCLQPWLTLFLHLFRFVHQ